MKIRTRLLLFLLPTFIGGIALISILLTYNRYTDIVISAGLTILLMTAMLFFIADKISKPIQKLNNSALALASGQYGASIPSEGPKEIVELSNTLSIMSECLLENINRLKENALLRERMYGEYECAILLQHLMLQKNIENFHSEALAIQPITFFSDTPKGITLQFPKAKEEEIVIELREAGEEGLEGMYQLLTESKGEKANSLSGSIRIDRAGSHLHVHGAISCFVWSMSQKQLFSLSAASLPIQSGDLFFLFNQGLRKFYKTPEHFAQQLTKVLSVFSVDGLETSAAMLRKEISFLAKRKDPADDLHLICFQILSL